MHVLEKTTHEMLFTSPRKEPIGCHCVFSVKLQPNGVVERCNARLVAKGYT